MAVSDSVQSSCEFLLQSVRSSGLNYFSQETPFSIFLTIRKSFARSFQFQPPPGNNLKSVPEKFEVTSNLIEENKSLKDDFYKVKADYEHAIGECESKYKEIEDLKEKLEILNEKLSMEQNNNVRRDDLNNMNIAKNEKKNAEIKLENVSKENKNLKMELEDLNDKIKTLHKDLKAAIKDKRNIAHDFEKKIEILETKHHSLLDYKISKEAEIKDLKVQAKAVNKKLKELAEKEAKLELNKVNFDKVKKEEDARKKRAESNMKSKSCQTHRTGDIKKDPETLLSHNPHIWTSSLCHTSTPFYAVDISTYPSMVSHMVNNPTKDSLRESQSVLNQSILEAFTKMYEELSAELQTMCDISTGVRRSTN